MSFPLRLTICAILTCVLAAAPLLLSGCGSEGQGSGGGADGKRADTPQTAAQRGDKGLK